MPSNGRSRKRSRRMRASKGSNAAGPFESRLARKRYLSGDRITEAAWRLFTTLVRFDAVYHGHLECNPRRMIDYPNLWGYARELYQIPGVSETVNLTQIKRHYYISPSHHQSQLNHTERACNRFHCAARTRTLRQNRRRPGIHGARLRSAGGSRDSIAIDGKIPPGRRP